MHEDTIVARAKADQLPDPESIRNGAPDALRKALEILQSYPKCVLSAVAIKLNHWQWDEALGEKPHNWDNMRDYRKPWMPADEVVREDYIRPYMMLLALCGIRY